MITNITLNPQKCFSSKIEESIKSPKIIVVNKFDEESAVKFEKEFSEALSTGQTIVPVVIDSYGGQVYSLFSMLDTIKNSPVPVATIAKGKSMSAGAVLFSSGTEGLRFISPNATIMIHEVSSIAWGKNEEIQADANHCKSLNKRLFEILSSNCGKSKNYFQKIYNKEKLRADWFLDADEALKHNLANHKRIPRLDVEVSLKMTLN